jgi:hypothetical protein
LTFDMSWAKSECRCAGLLASELVPSSTPFAPCPGALPRGSVTVKKPSAAALLLGLIPFAAMCFSVALWDRIYPMLFGIPFNMFWLICWIALSSVCLWAAYRVEAAR